MGTTGLTAQAFGRRDGAEQTATALRAGCLAIGIGTLLVALQTPLHNLAFWLVGASADVEALASDARPIRGRKAAASVAALASGEADLGELVAEALHRVGTEGTVAVEEGDGSRNSLQVTEGTRFDRGYLSPYFVTDPDRMESLLERALVLLTDGEIGTPADLLPVLEIVGREIFPS